YFRKESEPYMTIAIAGRGDEAGVTVSEVNLKFIWDVVSQIKVGQAGHAYVVDARGLLIAHPDISLVLQKTELAGLPQIQAAAPGPGRPAPPPGPGGAGRTGRRPPPAPWPAGRSSPPPPSSRRWAGSCSSTCRWPRRSRRSTRRSTGRPSWCCSASGSRSWPA